jgi:hypothetical protein
MSDWRSILKKDPTDWLMEENNPSVRYLTLKHLLGKDNSDPEVRAAKDAIPEIRPVAKILDKQHREGYWEDQWNPYHAKYKSSYWQIMILSQLGMDRSDERIRKGCEHVFQFQLDEGGFSSYTQECAARDYEWYLKRGKKLSPFKEWAAALVSEHQYSCLTGNMAATLIRLGYNDDPRVKRALEWLVKIQNEDGGWLCPYWHAHIKDTHSCFVGTITPLNALSMVPDSERTKDMKQAITKGAEFLLMHRLYKADHHDFKVIKPEWLSLHFPVLWYDILRGLRVLTELGYGRDERTSDAIELLKEKQTEDGKWLLERTPAGRMLTSLGKKGAPSKWVTLNALRVMKRLHTDTG